MIASGDGSSNTLVNHFAGVSFGNTVLGSYDVIGPVDLGCPA